MTRTLIRFTSLLLAAACLEPAVAGAQARGGGPAAPAVVSPEVSPDRRIMLRLYAPKAETVRLDASDAPGVPLGAGAPMTKGENGVWQVTVGPLPAGAYRYAFNVDGVQTLDPRNPATSESNNNSWSLVYVPGSDLFDTKPVPRGAVAEVTYSSASLGMFRRMHVYTPPGYETSGGRKYPVLYLLHGAGDSDDSWSTAGRAGFILDNLIAKKAAKEMIVVMPAGHTRVPAGAGVVSADANAAFSGDFMGSVVPYIEQHYRVASGRDNTAIAGLSMGGGQTLDIATANGAKFGYVGVFSSGLFGVFAIPGRGAPPPAWSKGSSEWEKRNAAALADEKTKKGLKLFWFSTGKDDFLLQTTRSTVNLFKEYGYSPVYKESDGGHTWINWRDYLSEFAPLLFR
jgi:enterochelin esterase family protein